MPDAHRRRARARAQVKAHPWVSAELTRRPRAESEFSKIEIDEEELRKAVIAGHVRRLRSSNSHPHPRRAAASPFGSRLRRTSSVGGAVSAVGGTLITSPDPP